MYYACRRYNYKLVTSELANDNTLISRYRQTSIWLRDIIQAACTYSQSGPILYNDFNFHFKTETSVSCNKNSCITRARTASVVLIKYKPKPYNHIY